MPAWIIPTPTPMVSPLPIPVSNGCSQVGIEAINGSGGLLPILLGVAVGIGLLVSQLKKYK